MFGESLFSTRRRNAVRLALDLDPRRSVQQRLAVEMREDQARPGAVGQSDIDEPMRGRIAYRPGFDP